MAAKKPAPKKKVVSSASKTKRVVAKKPAAKGKKPAAKKTVKRSSR